MMYDELIKRLRNCTAEQNGEKTLWCQAADAIENLDYIAQTYAETVHELEDKNRWIPVTERLPEPYTWVLVSAEKHQVAFDAFYDGAQWKDAVLNGLIVTHWMPLPQPPKEET